MDIHPHTPFSLSACLVSSFASSFPSTASATVTIVVTDVNDHPPKFTQPIYHATMSENCAAGESVTSISATDQDIGINARLTYFLEMKDREFFSMTSVEATNTGVLKVFKVIKTLLSLLSLIDQFSTSFG